VAFGPYDAAIDSISRSRRLLAIGASAPLGSRGDLRRMGVVMAVAALDTYMHRLIVDRAYRHRGLPRELAKLTVDFEQLLAEAEMSKAAARRPAHNSRPRVAIKQKLRDRLLLETFQRYEGVSRAMRMAGRTKGDWKAIGLQLQPQMTPGEVKERLNAIVTRRNQIVHEGDYVRLERPRKANRNDMTGPKAAADVDFIANLIDAIHAVI
jgi:hypothetical protein